ncbi:unnamed protein product [Staurois parvus]|uniref:SRR1-like domain-containing protein n=1 Tax=Staurois parvus TaxID=386267 RepID=A0ABN9FI95_9NEOB|nr:unnamed protein product [Staurois parvus]
MESDAWQVVGKRKIRKKSQRIKENSLCKAEGSSQDLDLVVNGKDVIKKIRDTMENLRISDFWKSCQGCLCKCQNIAPAVSKDNSDNGELMKSQCLEEDVPSHRCLQDYECVCYGLGNFASCVIARHQLAFLLLFLKQFKISYQQCYVFDPVFSLSEISVLQELDLKVISKNEEGKRGVQKPTVFYMLHCGKALYNNLLWRNWSLEALSQIIIIGNSFKEGLKKDCYPEFCKGTILTSLRVYKP